VTRRHCRRAAAAAAAGPQGAAEDALAAQAEELSATFQDLADEVAAVAAAIELEPEEVEVEAVLQARAVPVRWGLRAAGCGAAGCAAALLCW
jgi:hypothetical protein